jgi:antitoxin (DNA-binding transcriptional repressor) of toxin-antitoxin stability system
MLQITLTEAQQHLPEIISGLQPGEEIQIIQDDRPIARLVIDGLRAGSLRGNLTPHPRTIRRSIRCS